MHKLATLIILLFVSVTSAEESKRKGCLFTATVLSIDEPQRNDLWIGSFVNPRSIEISVDNWIAGNLILKEGDQNKYDVFNYSFALPPEVDPEKPETYKGKSFYFVLEYDESSRMKYLLHAGKEVYENYLKNKDNKS